MRGWLALSLTFVLVLAGGCLEESQAPSADEEVPEEDDEGRVARGGRDRDDDGEVRRSADVSLRGYSDQYGLTLTSAAAFVTLGNLQGENCVGVQGAPFTILNGTATLTWTSQSALTDSLDFTMRTYYSDLYEVQSGTSPLVVEFKDIELDDEQDELLFGVDVGTPGAAYELDVTLDLAFEYESDIDVDAFATYC
jgi:hypothetical protein